MVPEAEEGCEVAPGIPRGTSHPRSSAPGSQVQANPFCHMQPAYPAQERQELFEGCSGQKGLGLAWPLGPTQSPGCSQAQGRAAVYTGCHVSCATPPAVPLTMCLVCPWFARPGEKRAEVRPRQGPSLPTPQTASMGTGCSLEMGTWGTWLLSSPALKPNQTAIETMPRGSTALRLWSQLCAAQQKAQQLGPQAGSSPGQSRLPAGSQ